MKLSEAIESEAEDNSAAPRLDEFCAALDVEKFTLYDAEFDLRVKGYYLKKWLCTDTLVGTVVWFFDDRPVAMSEQPTRKSAAQYAFVSEERAWELKRFILVLMERDRLAPDILDLEGEIAETYRVGYGSTLLVDGVPCKVISCPSSLLADTVVVEFEDGLKKEIHVRELEIPLEVI